MDARKSRRRTIVLAAMITSMASAAHAAEVEIAVTGVAEARGHVHVDLCTRATFLKDDCPFSGAARATPGETLVRIDGVPPGEYAAQVFQDRNDNGKVDQNFLGVPLEPVGFSNDAPIRLTGPRFKDAAFAVVRRVERITLRLRRLFK